jgi:hypothetical protein
MERKARIQSKKNLTRFDYESSAFQGWRLCIRRGGSTFVRYFPDRRFGSARRSLEAADHALDEVRRILENAPRTDGRLRPSTIRRVEKLLARAV